MFGLVQASALCPLNGRINIVVTKNFRENICLFLVVLITATQSDVHRLILRSFNSAQNCTNLR